MHQKNMDVASPLISVVVLTYNNFGRLFFTLETILMQDYPNIEIIISDDASEYFPAQEIDNWFRNNEVSDKVVRFEVYRNERNLGIVAHSNLAAKQYCTGTYIKFLPVGDGLCDSNSLSKLARLFGDTMKKVVTSPALIYKDEISSICYQFPSPRRVRIINGASPKRLFRVLAFSNIISAIGTMYHRDFFKGEGFDSAYAHLDDWPTWLQIAINGETIPCAESPTVYYQLGGISSRGGTVFKSALLKSDLLLCYKKEILPHEYLLPWYVKRYIHYQYNKLTGEKNNQHVIFLPFTIFELAKKIIKKILISRKR